MKKMSNLLFMTKKSTRWGMIGTGNVTEQKSGPAFSKVEASQLLAVANRSPEKAKDYALRHGVPRWHSDPMDLIRDADVDLVYVATPPDAHLHYALACLDAGKSVYLEKPMALNHAECKLINLAALKAGLPVYVAYYRRALPYFLKVKEMLESGILGKLIHVRLDQLFPARDEDLDPANPPWRVIPEISGGGYFHDMGCHALDLLFFLLGDPVMVEGMARNEGGLYAADDTVDAMIGLPGGLALKGHWSFVTPPDGEKDRVEVLGTEGSLYFSVFSFEDIRLQRGGKVELFSFERPPHIQQSLIQTIVDEHQGQGSCPSTGETAAVTSLVMDRICHCS